MGHFSTYTEQHFGSSSPLTLYQGTSVEIYKCHCLDVECQGPWTSCLHLALLDYVSTRSRAYEIEVCPAAIRPLVRICVKYSLWLPRAVRSEVFFFRKQFPIVHDFVSFSLIRDPIGAINTFKTLLQITAKMFQTFPNFSSQWSSPNYVGDFEISSSDF